MYWEDAHLKNPWFIDPTTIQNTSTGIDYVYPATRQSYDIGSTEYANDAIQHWQINTKNEKEKKEMPVEKKDDKVIKIGYIDAVKLKDVRFSGPATIIFWEDGKKTIVKRTEDDDDNKELALAMGILKRICGDEQYPSFKKWMKKTIEAEEKRRIKLEKVDDTEPVKE